jgi:hypothetical protein
MLMTVKLSWIYFLAYAVCVAMYDPFHHMNHLINFHEVSYESHPNFLQPITAWQTHEHVRWGYTTAI